MNLIARLFDSNEKQINKIKPLIARINELEPVMQKLSDDELRAKTTSFREKLGVDLATARLNTDDFNDISKESKKPELKKEQNALMDILPEAYAVVREASHRVANHRHFDVQLMAGYFSLTTKQ